MLVSAIESFGEAAALVSGHGIESQTLLDVITNSLFPGPVYQGYGKMIAERRYEPALFKARLGPKDVRLAVAVGERIDEVVAHDAHDRQRHVGPHRPRRWREGLRRARSGGGASRGTLTPADSIPAVAKAAFRLNRRGETA